MMDLFPTYKGRRNQKRLVALGTGGALWHRRSRRIRSASISGCDTFIAHFANEHLGRIASCGSLPQY